MNKNNVLILILLLVVVFIIDIYLLNFSAFNNDEASWALYAMDSLRNKVFPTHGIEGSIGIYQGLLVVYLYMALFSLFGCSMNVIGAFLIILHLLSIFILYFVVRRMYNPFVGFLTCLFYITSRVFISGYSLQGNDYCFYFIPLTLAIYSLYKIINEGRQIYFILFAISIGLATQCHSSAYFIIPAFLVYLIFNFTELRRNKKIVIYIILSLITLFIFTGSHLYSIFMGLGKIKSHIAQQGDMFQPLRLISKHVSSISSLQNLRIISFKKPISFLFEPNILLLILFILFSHFKSISLRFKRNDYLLFSTLLITMLLFMVASYYFYTPSPVVIVFFPVVFIAQASLVNKIYSNIKDKIVLKKMLFFCVALIIILNCATSILSIKLIKKTGGVGWHRPTRSVRIAVINYIFSLDGNPNIILVGDPNNAWWSYSPYRFIIETLKTKSKFRNNLSFYIIEEKSMWYKPIFNAKIENINVIDEKRIGSVK